MSRPSSRSPSGRDGLPVTIVHACLREGRGGSPTAVVDEASAAGTGRPLTDEERRRVPALAGTSHAVFLSDGRGPVGGGDEPPAAPARFFTTEGELPACGHGTVAALAFLAARADHGEYRAGLRVSGRAVEGRAVPGAPTSFDVTFGTGPVRLREPTQEELALLLPLLGLPAAAGPGARVATLGRPRLLVPVTTRSALASLSPSPGPLAAACDRLGLLGCFVHSPGPTTARVAARMFAPSIGVTEDIVNVNSSACLAAHLLARHGTPRIDVDMGDALGRPSTVTAGARRGLAGLPVDVTGVAKLGQVLRLPR
ncbi:PhzF family phenazine biosynthesis protein [Streptomyces populi]|uniref:PhzF family phenazine biosynthesis protein n=1 Tax=Streptomyces populi TaxID=2058924 RepID=A0A2I0STY3_9ACTN|nr:PhzF family phenazine biosynthesis protein [Streptomyces populi]PKT73404.1 PhzF family phenazine biosynthesis protein [Streptomyces populi]